MGITEIGKKGKRAVFLDRDGVINENRKDYVKTWDEFVFLPGSLEALKALACADFLLVVVTNQSAIHRGLVSRDTVEEINSRMVKQSEDYGARIDGVYYCPHAPNENCNCRKPLPGLFLRAAEEMQINLERSYCVGDKITDINAGKAAGCRNILVLTGEGQDQILDATDDYIVARDLQHAVKIILNDPVPA